MTSNRGIQKFHERFLKKKTPTDVLTFLDKKNIDIVVSLDQAFAQAKPRGLKLFHEVALLICHGLLHAKGFLDDTEKETQTMRKLEFEWLAKVL